MEATGTVAAKPQEATSPLFQMARWETFDMLRALAITLVFLFHYNGFAGPITRGAPWLDSLESVAGRLGSIGTNLFLLLTGLFIARSVARENFLYWKFSARRLIRIYPPYLLVIGAALAFWFAFPAFSRLAPGATLASVLWENIILWPGLSPNSPVLTVTWTLSWIMAAYVVLPLPLRTLRIHVKSGVRRIMILSGVLLLYLTLAFVISLASPRVGYVAAGCIVFELVTIAPERYASRDRMWRMVVLAVTALVLRIVIEGAGNWHSFEVARRVIFTALGLTGLSLLSVAAFIVQVRYPLHYYEFPLNPVRLLGRVGFSFYLLHGPVTKLFAFIVLSSLPLVWPSPWAGWLVMPACFLSTALLSAIMFYWVERPLQQFGKARF